MGRLTDDSRTDKVRRRRQVLRCFLCPPHRHENAKHHKQRPDKHKNKRRI